MWHRTLGLLILAVLVAVAAGLHRRPSDHYHHPAGHGLLFLHHHRIRSSGSL
jgi:hypothetical protein